MEPSPFSEKAVSEIVGALILMAIMATAVGIVGVTMFSQHPPENIPALNAIISNNTQTIKIYHDGGETLRFDEIQILLDGVNSIGLFRQDGKNWSTWSMGQSLEYTILPSEKMPKMIQIVYISSSGASYVLAYTGSGSGGFLSVAPPSVTGITPATWPPGSVVHITELDGSGFSYSGPSVKLHRAGYTDITASNVYVLSQSLIQCDFDLTGAAVGSWDIAVTNPDGLSGTLPNGFTVTNPVPPVADFSSSTTTGQVPFTVEFGDLSTGFPTTWKWAFGDGSWFNTTTYNDRNPLYSYYSAGTYTVNLTVANSLGSSTASKTNYITVTAPPPAPVVADLTANITSGIRPLVVQFTDASTGPVINWSWAFGDGGTSYLKNPVHTFTTAGNYTVTHNVENGIFNSTHIELDYIWVTDPVILPVNADFTANTTSGDKPLAVKFTDASTGPVSNWSWAFGDGATSYLQSPAYSYATAGTYTVNLTVSNSTGGTNSKSWANYITVTTPPLAVSSIFPSTGVKGTTVFISNLAGTSFQTGATVTFIIGANTITATNVTVVSSGRITCDFAIPNSGWATGAWDVRVTNPDAQTATLPASFTVTTAPPLPVTASFTGSPTSGNKPLPVQFTDASTGPVTSWLWTFGDGDSTNATVQHPLHLYANAGTYTVSLTVSNGSGTNTLTRTNYITVTTAVPVAGFFGTPASGTAPLTVRFTDTSTNVPTSWLWNFGDGDSTNSTIQNPVHRYAGSGFYTVALTATNTAGSNTLTRPNYINVSSPPVTPVAGFTGTPTSGAAPLTVRFTDTSTNVPTSWLWNFGDGSSTNSTVQNPVHRYAGAGIYSVALTATNAAGSNTLTRTGYITVAPPPIPTFSGISPSPGVYTGGETVTITGTGFTGVSSVTIGGAPSIVLSVNGAGTTITATTPPNADGGAVNVVITTPGGTVTGTNAYRYYRIRTYTAGTTTWTVPANVNTVEYLVVAGGGGGGRYGAGGGAGGFRTGTLTGLSGSQTVTVGAGGAGGTVGLGTSGSNSVFGSIIANGGGGGAGNNNIIGGNGGSGGGGTRSTGTVGTGIAGQGYNGGMGVTFQTNRYNGGGGGGASSVGGTATQNVGAVGGNGRYSAISGINTAYAGGGGGGGRTAFGTGGVGGGGAGSVSAQGNLGSANTGGGGGGGGYSTAGGGTLYNGGSGGSGIIIIKYY